MLHIIIIKNAQYWYKKMYHVMFVCLFVFGMTAPQWARASPFSRFLDHTRHTTISKTPLDE